LIFLLHADHHDKIVLLRRAQCVASKPGKSFCQRVRRSLRAFGGRFSAAQISGVRQMLEEIHREGDDGSKFIAAAKDKGSGRKLMGFGHRVYKNYDPRAKNHQKKHVTNGFVQVTKSNDPLFGHRQTSGRGRAARFIFRRAQTLSERGFLQRHYHARARHSVEMFPVIFAIDGCPAGLRITRKSWKNRRAAFTVRARFTSGARSIIMVPLDGRK